ncbi:hypothetical protein Drorol1_Dr00004578 [Drosera rotundifolia]
MAAMAIRATLTSPASLPPSPGCHPSSFRVLSTMKQTPSESKFKFKFPISNGHFSSSFTISLLALFTSPSESKAFSISKDQIVSSLTQVEETIDQVQEMGSGVLGAGQRVFDIVVEKVKPGVDVAVPLLKQAGEEALKVVGPVVVEATKKAGEVIRSAGIDTEPVFSAAKTVTDAAQQTTRVIEDAKPVVSTTVETISSYDPVVIVGALFFVGVLLPPIWGAITFNLRGYQGALTPAQTLDLLCSQSHFLIDIRSEKEKNKAGIPFLPPSAKSRVIAIPIEELPAKLRSLVRSTRDVEAEIAALKISYLKRIGKGSNIVIMDTYTDSAKIVARTLTRLGFKNCWIMADGFSGGRGWLESRLGTESYNLSIGQILSPSRIIPAGARRLAAGSSIVQSS